MTIRISRQRIHGKSIKVTLSCGRNAPCSGINLTVTTSARHHTITIAELRVNLRRGQKKTLTVTLNRNGRTLLASTRKLAITIAVRLAAAPAAKPTTARTIVTA